MFFQDLKIKLIGNRPVIKKVYYTKPIATYTPLL